MIDVNRIQGLYANKVESMLGTNEKAAVLLKSVLNKIFYEKVLSDKRTITAEEKALDEPDGEFTSKFFADIRCDVKNKLDNCGRKSRTENV
jgi:hypothetical protein